MQQCTYSSLPGPEPTMNQTLGITMDAEGMKADMTRQESRESEKLVTKTLRWHWD